MINWLKKVEIGPYLPKLLSFQVFVLSTFMVDQYFFPMLVETLVFLKGSKFTILSYVFFLIKKAQVLRYHCKILFETNVQRYAHLSYSLQKSKSTYFQEYRGFERRISEINVIIPAQVWSAPKDDAPWKSYPSEYNQGIIIAKNKFFEKIDMQ